jgi:hypothetical protein
MPAQNQPPNVVLSVRCPGFIADQAIHGFARVEAGQNENAKRSADAKGLRFVIASAPSCGIQEISGRMPPIDREIFLQRIAPNEGRC